MDIESRVLAEAYYMISTNKTLREIALVFGVSKSTVHNDLKKRLFDIDKQLFWLVKGILNYHTEIRHINGGMRTRKKYLKMAN